MSTDNKKRDLLGYFILQPTFAILLVIGLIAGGLIAYSSLVKESSPDLEIPQATVTIGWPGADPQTIESQVTYELEKEIKGISGLKKISSASYDSFASVAVEFGADEDVTDAMNRLRTAVSQAEAGMPRSVDRATVHQASLSDRPVVSLVLYGDVAEQTRNTTAKALERRLEKIVGVNEVKLSGYREEVVRIRLLPERVAAVGLSASQVRSRISDASFDQPWDRFESPEEGSFVIVFRGRYQDVEQLENIPITRLSQGRVVRLAELADVSRGLEREQSRAYLSQAGEAYTPTIDISITRMPGSDTVKLAENILDELEAFKASSRWPEGMQAYVTSDQSVDIWKSLSDALSNGIQAMVAVFVVLLIALSWREALIAGLAIPLTFLSALLGIWVVGYTLNELVIIGMILALGMLVDVFILMMEGMHDAIYTRGMRFNDAARDTVKTYAAPAFAGQLTTILALAPLMAIGGVAGKFMRTIPVAAIICLVFAYILALLACIPLSRFVLKTSGGTPTKGRIDKITERANTSMTSWIRRSLVASKGKAVGAVVGCLAIFGVSLVAASTLPMELYGSDDGRDLGITVVLPTDSVTADAQRCADGLGEVLRGEGYLESVTKFVGKKSPLAMTSAGASLEPSADAYLLGFSAKFVPLDDRDKMAFEYLDELRVKLLVEMGACPGGELFFSPQMGGAAAGPPIQIELAGEDLDELRAASQELRGALASMHGPAEVRDNMGAPRPTLEIRPDREALDFYGLSESDLSAQVRLAIAEDPVLTLPQPGTDPDLDVVIGTAWASRGGKAGGPTNLTEAASVRIRAPDGRYLALPQLVETTLVDAPLSIPHTGAERAITVSAHSYSRPASEVLVELEPELQRLRSEYPEVTIKLAGEAESTAETFGSAGQMLIIALFAVFAVLVLQFSSFKQPIIMMFVVPLSLSGTFFLFVATGLSLSFPAVIGIISLVGIVVNNSIVMISAMNALRAEGAKVAEAAAVGAASRLRPILSTTITTLAGLIPLAMSGAMWLPLAGAIIGGLLAGTVFAFIVTPSLYFLLERDS